MQEATSQVDVWQLALSGGTLRGDVPLERFPRLLAGLPAQADRRVDWVLTGETDAAGQRFMALQANTIVTLECQRCLALFDLPLQVGNRLQLVETEAEEMTDDDPDVPDQVLGSTRFDVLSLVEDELILALPYVPKHEVCPSPPKALETGEGDDNSRPSPFAALAALKKD